MEINLFTEGKITFPYKDLEKRDLKNYLLNICKNLKIYNTTLTLILTDNKYIHKVNREYRRKDNPTDVITFSYKDPPFPDIGSQDEILGEIYLSLEMAALQAIDYRVSFKGEVKRLLIHAVLHLIGYDHEKSKKYAKRMKDKEDEILRIICNTKIN